MSVQNLVLGLVVCAAGVQINNEPFIANQFVQASSLSSVSARVASYAEQLAAIDAMDISEN